MGRILIIDDVETNRFVLRNIISDMGHQPVLAENGIQGLKLLDRIIPDLILLDVSMPEMDGFEFCLKLKQDIKTRHIPIIFISAMDEPQDIVKAFEVGGADYVTKPFIQEVVKSRVEVHLKMSEMNRDLVESNRRLQASITEQIKQMEAEKKRVLYALLAVARKNACFEEEHMERLQYDCKLLAQAMQLSPKYEHLVSDTFVETIELAAPLCDLGNVAIPQEILQKKGKLTKEELDIVKTHTTLGAQILSDIRQDGGDYNDFVDMSYDVALFHHEKWDGTGYPQAIAGDEIPLSAQIVGMVTTYCALTADRSFRKAFSREEALEHMELVAGVDFNAEIFNIFKKIARQLH